MGKKSKTYVLIRRHMDTQTHISIDTRKLYETNTKTGPENMRNQNLKCARFAQGRPKSHVRATEFRTSPIYPYIIYTHIISWWKHSSRGWLNSLGISPFSRKGNDLRSVVKTRNAVQRLEKTKVGGDGEIHWSVDLCFMRKNDQNMDMSSSYSL